MRTKSKEDMTITEQLNQVKTSICDKYCRFPQTVHEMWLKEEIEDRDEFLEEKYCNSCPLREL